MNNWLMTLVAMIFGQASVAMRENLTKTLNEWQVKARQTNTPVDDVFVSLLKALCGIP